MSANAPAAASFPAPDESALDREGAFDFPQLVADLHVNWQISTMCVAPVADLCNSVADLVEALPVRLASSDDETLVALLEQVLLAAKKVDSGMKMLRYTHGEMRHTFAQLSDGFRAAYEIQMHAERVGYGRA